MVLWSISAWAALRATVSCRDFLSPRCGHPDADLAAAAVAEQLLHGGDVGRQLRHQHLARDGVGLAAVHLQQEALDQVRGVAVVHPVRDPGPLPPDPAAADVEDLHGHLQRVLGQRDHIGVRAVAEHHGLLLQGLLEGTEVVAQPRRALEVLGGGGGVHLLLDPAGERGGVAGHEVAEVVDDRPVLLRRHRADAGGRALADVAEQARAADLAGPLEDTVGARAHREDPEQQVHRLPDRPGVAVGAEVAGALALRTAPDHHPRELLTDGHRQPGVGLVVAVLHVEARVELLDPGVLQLEGLDLGADHRPVDARRAGHHRGGALVQSADVLEVRREAGPEVLGLAHVDHPSARVAEPVDARLRGDRAGLGSVAQGGAATGTAGHVPTLRRGADAPQRETSPVRADRAVAAR